ncbi:MAG: murein biosynthesis integral membrane protein MurJ [Bacillota bacterium]
MSRPVGRVMISAALSIMVINAATKVLGFARDQGLAVMFGAGPQSDAYMVASTIPTLLFGTVAGAVGAAFLPVFTEYLCRERSQEAWDLASSLLNTVLLASAALAVLGMLLAPQVVTVIAPGFDAGTSQLASRLLFLMFPAIIATGVYSLLAAVLHSFRRFIAPALGPMVLNITVILGIYLVAPRWGIPAVAAATLVGSGLQTMIVLAMVSRTGLRYRWGINWHHPGLARVLALSVPIVLGGLTGQAYLIIDRRLASGLEAGSISALAFANKLVQLPLGLFALAIATVLYPAFSEYASGRDYRALGQSVQSGLRMVALITLPASVGLMVLREPIIRLLFQRGQFDARSTQLTAVAVLCYGLGMLFHASNQVLVRGFHSMQDTVRPVLISGGTVCINLVFAVLLVRPLGHAGLALANSIGALSGFVLLVALLRNTVPLPHGPFLRTMGRLAVSSVIMGLAAVFTHRGAQWVFRGRWGGLLEVGAAIGVGCLVYAIMLWRLGVDDLQPVLALVRNWTRPRAM